MAVQDWEDLDAFLDLEEFAASVTLGLTCKAADVTDVRRRDTVTINGETMDVMTDPQPDGTGLAVLALARRHG
jgi:hypothetical protein